MTEPTKEGTTTCVVDHEGDESKKETVVGEEAASSRPTNKKTTQGANTLRKKKKRKMKEQQEASAAGPGVEPKADAASPPEEPKSESDARAKNEAARNEEQAGENKVSQKGEEGTATATSPRNENGDTKKNEDESSKNENEGEKKSKAGKKKGKKKSKKENGGGEASKDGAESSSEATSQQPKQGPGDNLSPRPPPKKTDDGEEKKKKKKKKPKTPRGDAGGVITTTTTNDNDDDKAPEAEPSLTGSAGLVKPLKLNSSDGTNDATKSHKKSKKGAQTDRAGGERVTNPPLSAVRAGPSAALLASAPSAGIKFASRLSLANVIPKMSTLPFEKKPRIFNSNVYAQPFSGKLLVKWMLEADTGVRFEPEAMILGELMLNAGVIVPLSRKVEFSPSSKDFYALTEAYADYARPRGLSLGGSMIARVGSADETKKLTRRSSVMLSFRSLSMRGLNHLAGVSKDKDKDKKDDDTKEKETIQLVYGRSLEEVMGLQLQTHPDEKIPVILKTLTKAIIDTQGHKTEGIFRVPGKNDEISRLKAQFNKADYTITSDDPNDLGGCLKMWFRELKDPLIPNDIYDECVMVANDPAACLEMVRTRVPELNRTVIYFLLGFLQEMCRHAGITRMGSANLGMVFAPGLLRCEDVMKMMNNTAHEGAFVKNLIEHFRPEDEDAAATATTINKDSGAAQQQQASSPA